MITKLRSFVRNNYSEILFCLVIFFTSACFIDSGGLLFFFTKFKYRWLKLVLSFVLPSAVTVLQYRRRRQLEFIGRAVAIVSAVYVALFIIDSLTLQLMYRIERALVIFHLSYGLVTFFSVLLICTLITIKEKRGIGYSKFCRSFFTGYIVMFLLCFVFIFFVSRDYGSDSAAVNLIPFMGEFRTLLDNGITNDFVRDLGNVFFFSSMSMLIMEFVKRRSAMWGIVLPILTSLSMEVLQYFLRCGDPDIDDVIANTVGAVIGVVFYRLIIEKLKERERMLCSE